MFGYWKRMIGLIYYIMANMEKRSIDRCLIHKQILYDTYLLPLHEVQQAIVYIYFPSSTNQCKNDT